MPLFRELHPEEIYFRIDCMSEIPPIQNEEANKKDIEHLRILAICHYIGGGLALLGLVFVGAHFMFMRMFFENPAMWQNAKGGPPPEVFFTLFKVFYALAIVASLTFAALNFISASSIQKRKRMTFTMIVAGINCIHIPLGTVLGVFTFIVLSRESVKELYRKS